MLYQCYTNVIPISGDSINYKWSRTADFLTGLLRKSSKHYGVIFYNQLFESVEAVQWPRCQPISAIYINHY